MDERNTWRWCAVVIISRRQWPFVFKLRKWHWKKLEKRNVKKKRDETDLAKFTTTCWWPYINRHVSFVLISINKGRGDLCIYSPIYEAFFWFTATFSRFRPAGVNTYNLISTDTKDSLDPPFLVSTISIAIFYSISIRNRRNQNK